MHLRLINYLFIITSILHIGTSFVTEKKYLALKSFKSCPTKYDVGGWNSITCNFLNQLKSYNDHWRYTKGYITGLCLFEVCMEKQVTILGGNLCPDDMKRVSTNYCEIREEVETSDDPPQLNGECYYKHCKKISEGLKDHIIRRRIVNNMCATKDNIKAEDECYAEKWKSQTDFFDTFEYYQCVKFRCAGFGDIIPLMCDFGEMFEHVKSYCLLFKNVNLADTIECISKLCHILSTNRKNENNEVVNHQITAANSQCNQLTKPKIATQASDHCMKLINAEGDFLEKTTLRFHRCRENQCLRNTLDEHPCPYDMSRIVEGYCSTLEGDKDACYKKECKMNKEVRDRSVSDVTIDIIGEIQFTKQICILKNDLVAGYYCYNLHRYTKVHQERTPELKTNMYHKCVNAKCDIAGYTVPVICPSGLVQIVKRYCTYKETESYKQTHCYNRICTEFWLKFHSEDQTTISNTMANVGSNCVDYEKSYRAEDTCMRSMDEYTMFPISIIKYYDCVVRKCSGSIFVVGDYNIGTY